MADYNLTDNVKTDFPFAIGDLKYKFRYPTTAEMRELGELNKELQALIKSEADEKLVKAKSEESEEKMNALISPIDHTNPIGEVLDNMPLPVVRNFRAMMARELSLE